MNRADRRRLQRTVARALKRVAAARPGSLEHPAPASVTLSGGPMDGWVVKPDAPALDPGWCLTWPPTSAAKHAPGQYLPAGPGRARWEPL